MTAAYSGVDQTSNPQPDSFGTAHAQLLADRNLQFDMAPMTPPEMPPWLEPLARFLQAIAPLLVWVFWGGVIITVLIVLYFIVSEIVRRLPDRRPREDAATAAVPQYRPAPARARALLEQADKLAAEGKYSEAVRVLLHRSIDDLERVFSVRIGRDLTSREIAQLEPLSREGRSVFTRLARAVEISLFGGRLLNAEDFRSCRESYASFALSGSGR